MKIAAKISMTALATVLVLAMGVAHTFAQPAPSQPLATDVVTPPQAAPAAAPASVVSPAKGDSSVKEVLDSIKVPGASEPEEIRKSPTGKNSKDATEEKRDPLSSPKIPDSVKKAVKGLNDATDGVTLENLNSAREAVVKLDVLIDIEKRLNDLSKLRKDRGGDSDSLAESLPHSALQPPSMDGSMGEPPPSLIPIQNMGANRGQPMIMPSADIAVMRVSGASGHYSAQVKDADGSTKTVKIGDKLADSSLVNSISREGVTLTTPDKKTKTIQVKDISTVFSSR